MAQLMTIATACTAELEEKGSRFIGHLVPHANFAATLADLREQHPKASHHVTAFRHMLPDGRIEEGAKDDGEPAGTSGMPMLKVLIGANMINVGLIVVRYFGGTKLGSGGLARAYSGTAASCINAAIIEPWHRTVRRTLAYPFEKMSEAERHIAAQGLSVISRDFTDTGCTLTVEGPEESVSRLPDSAAPVA
jgi:uncharacterized YigZ family protein